MIEQGDMASLAHLETGLLAGGRIDADSAPKPFVLNVSGDFPDPIEPFKTQAIRALVELTGDRFDHRVISINRAEPGFVSVLQQILRGNSQPLSVQSQDFDQGAALRYSAPGRGIFHATFLHKLGDWLVEQITAGPLPSLIVGHKLTIEGIAVYRAAKTLGIPFAISLQGDTDTKILQARPDLAAEFGKIFHEAAMVFPFAPWTLDVFERRLGKRKGATAMLPCATELDTPMEPRAGGDGLLSVFHLKNYRRKNLKALVEAMERLGALEGSLQLAIVGGGNEAEIARCREIAGDNGKVVFEGPLDRQAISARMNRATGFVLPSKRESFGLVFIEALFAGLPVAYPRGAAIDGYFDGAPFAIAVDALDTDELAQAMQTLVTEESSLKAELREWQMSAAARRFQRASIGDTFANGLLHALRASPAGSAFGQEGMAA